MANPRCDLCGVPMPPGGATGYCSERCLCWDFFGVPALKEQEFIKEVRANQRTNDPRQTRQRAYPDLFSVENERVLVDALAHIKMYCNSIRTNGKR